MDEKAVIKTLADVLVGNLNADKTQRRQKCNELKQRIRKLGFAISKLYEDRVTGILF